MKTYLTILFVIALSACTKAQTPDTSFNYKDDFILAKIISALPQGWTFSEKAGEFIIERTDSVIVVNREQLQIPANRKISEDTISKFGYRSKSMIVYAYTPRWTFEQKSKINSNNTQIYQQLKKLPAKYKITGLLDRTKSSRGNDVYTGKTEAEKELVSKYDKEKSELMAKLIQMPNYNTDKYCLFLKSTQGCNDREYSVYPEKASLQLYEILANFSEMTEK